MHVRLIAVADLFDAPSRPPAQLVSRDTTVPGTLRQPSARFGNVEPGFHPTDFHLGCEPESATIAPKLLQ